MNPAEVAAAEGAGGRYNDDDDCPPDQRPGGQGYGQQGAMGLGAGGPMDAGMSKKVISDLISRAYGDTVTDDDMVRSAKRTCCPPQQQQCPPQPCERGHNVCPKRRPCTAPPCPPPAPAAPAPPVAAAPKMNTIGFTPEEAKAIQELQEEYKGDPNIPDCDLASFAPPTPQQRYNAAQNMAPAPAQTTVQNVEDMGATDQCSEPVVQIMGPGYQNMGAESNAQNVGSQWQTGEPQPDAPQAYEMVPQNVEPAPVYQNVDPAPVYQNVDPAPVYQNMDQGYQNMDQGYQNMEQGLAQPNLGQSQSAPLPQQSFEPTWQGGVPQDMGPMPMEQSMPQNIGYQNMDQGYQNMEAAPIQPTEFMSNAHNVGSQWQTGEPQPVDPQAYGMVPQNVEPVYQNVEPVYQNVDPAPVYQNVEPVYQNVEPVYQNVDPAPVYQNMDQGYQNMEAAPIPPTDFMSNAQNVGSQWQTGEPQPDAYGFAPPNLGPAQSAPLPQETFQSTAHNVGLTDGEFVCDYEEENAAAKKISFGGVQNEGNMAQTFVAPPPQPVYVDDGSAYAPPSPNAMAAAQAQDEVVNGTPPHPGAVGLATPPQAAGMAYPYGGGMPGMGMGGNAYGMAPPCPQMMPQQMMAPGFAHAPMPMSFPPCPNTGGFSSSDEKFIREVGNYTQKIVAQFHQSMAEELPPLIERSAGDAAKAQLTKERLVSIMKEVATPMARKMMKALVFNTVDNMLNTIMGERTINELFPKMAGRKIGCTKACRCPLNKGPNGLPLPPPDSCGLDNWAKGGCDDQPTGRTRNRGCGPSGRKPRSRSRGRRGGGCR